MLMKRLYDEGDLTRFRTEREAHVAAHTAKLATAGVQEDLLEVMATKMAERTVAPAKIRAVEIVQTGASQAQNFSTRMVLEGIAQGYLRLDGDKLTLKAEPEDLTYLILRKPGRYCLHCGEKLPDDLKGELSRLHVATEHLGVASPDPDVPAGYVLLSHFECRLNLEQHARYKAGVSTLERVEQEYRKPDEARSSFLKRIFGRGS